MKSSPAYVYAHEPKCFVCSRRYRPNSNSRDFTRSPLARLADGYDYCSLHDEKNYHAMVDWFLIGQHLARPEADARAAGAAWVEAERRQDNEEWDEPEFCDDGPWSTF